MMPPSQINQLISRAIEQDVQTNNTLEVLKAGFRQSGQAATRKQLKALVEFIREYVKNVPSLLAEFKQSAEKKGLARQIAPMLKTIEQYFLEPNDFIPDHLGLVGLLDDAYLSQRLIEILSVNYYQATGKRLVNVDLSQGNGVIRNLLGEPIAQVLEATVMNTIQMPNMQQFIRNMLHFQAMMPITAPHPEYGMTSNREIADLRIGVKGVV